ncbi:hypothetical protein ES332_A13G112900v1 [Gossypium tomentosum]|uniref:Uncharacterized protein n=1 Tax=Gossypium tomentosum TaxID=34277 RepID=A0A5D2MIR1_GOSTO|nr:hypothetical protein ES332_A13G112900v1 [Gossypium tomentosum]
MSIDFLSMNTWQVEALKSTFSAISVLPDFAEVYSFSYCFLLLLYYRAPEIIFGVTIYTTAIDICSSLCLLVRVE